MGDFSSMPNLAAALESDGVKTGILRTAYPFSHRGVLPLSLNTEVRVDFATAGHAVHLRLDVLSLCCGRRYAVQLLRPAHDPSVSEPVRVCPSCKELLLRDLDEMGELLELETAKRVRNQQTLSAWLEAVGLDPLAAYLSAGELLEELEQAAREVFTPEWARREYATNSEKLQESLGLAQAADVALSVTKAGV